VKAQPVLLVTLAAAAFLSPLKTGASLAMVAGGVPAEVANVAAIVEGTGALQKNGRKALLFQTSKREDKGDAAKPKMHLRYVIC
jgi:hypothetical protein